MELSSKSSLFIALQALILLSITSIANAQPIPLKKPKLPNADASIVISKPATKKTSIPNIVPKKPSEQKITSFISNVIPSVFNKSDSDLKRNIKDYKKIFSLQEKSKFKKADKEIEKLENKSLIGHILLHRYMHPTGYQSTFEELTSWLRLYSDHPNASRIYKLAKKRIPSDYSINLKEPDQTRYMNGSIEDSKYKFENFKPVEFIRNEEQENLLKESKDAIKKHIAQGEPSEAIKILNSFDVRVTISQSEKDIILSKIARSYLIEGNTNKAFNLSSIISDRYGEKIPLSGWIAGISAWQQNKYSIAAQYFQKTASSTYANKWLISASSYWAARSFAKIHNKDKENEWLQEAALFPRTFYGILANQKLGVTEEFNWNKPVFTQNLRKVLLGNIHGERAYYLANLGFQNLANMELELIDPNNSSILKTSILAFAHHYNLTRFLFKFGNSIASENGTPYDAALYPYIKVKNNKDTALINAFIRQESRFKADAYSSGGAIGLMQILPSTAEYISNKKKLGTFSRSLLLEPNKNIEIGSYYIENLMNSSNVNNNLFYLLIAYNAGPGKLANWKKKIEIYDDPLLFMEVLPSPETRAFLERVTANLWIYQEQLKQERSSLHQILLNKWPIYQ